MIVTPENRRNFFAAKTMLIWLEKTLNTNSIICGISCGIYIYINIYIYIINIHIYIHNMYNIYSAFLKFLLIAATE